jgi:hypothetical protein
VFGETPPIRNRWCQILKRLLCCSHLVHFNISHIVVWELLEHVLLRNQVDTLLEYWENNSATNM